MITLEHMQQAQQRHAAYYLGRCREIGTLFQQGGPHTMVAMQKAKQMWGQIQQGQAWAAGNLSVHEAASLCLAYTETTLDVMTAFQPLSDRIRWLSDSLAAARQIGDHEATAKFLIELGESRLFRGDDTIDRCKALFEEALTLARAHALDASEARALLSLGRAESLNPAQIDRARGHMETALSMFRRLDHPSGIGDCLRNLGTLEERAGNLERAKRYQREALDVYRRLNDDRSAAIVLKRLASIAERETDYTTGRDYAEQALALARQTGDVRAIVNCLAMLGLVCDYLGDHAVSQAYFEEMLRLSRSIGDRRYISVALTNLGYMANTNGDHRQAIGYFAEVLTIARRMNDRYREAVALGNLGAIHLDVAALDDGRRELREALRIAHAIQAGDLIMSVLLDLARLWVMTGQPNAGAELFGLALTLSTGADPQDQEYIDRTEAALRRLMPEERFVAGVERGRALDRERTIQRLLESE